VDTIECLWNAFNDAPDELFRLGIIADAYDDIGDEDAANCLRWAWREGKKPTDEYTGCYEWFSVKGYTCPSEDHANLGIEFLSISYQTDFLSEYCNGHESPSLAYQFLIRMWKAIGGIKETVTA